MSPQPKSHPGRVLAMLPVMIAVLCAFATNAAAQDQPAPKWEIFGGYSFFHPGADIHGQLPLGLFPLSSRLEANPRGAGVSATYNFNRWLGLTLDGSTHWGSGEVGVQKRIDDTGISNLSIGPKVTFRSAHFSPFLEALVGDHRLMPEAFHHVDKLGFLLGGGLDINLSRHVALRLLRADYVISSYQYGPPGVPATEIRGARLQTGFNFMFGGGAPPEPTSPSAAACSVQPSEVFAGEPVTATATGSNFNARRTVRYEWSGTGVKVSGSNASTQIDTTGLQPGSYQVAAKLSDGSRRGVAMCNAAFTVRQPNAAAATVSQPIAPSISCSPDPATVQAGGRSTIRSSANSPDNRPLTYSYSASAGRISGSDSSATLNTAGAEPGPITVTCNVADDRNPALTASSTTTVTVEAPTPPPPPAASPEASRLNQIEFKKNSPRVDNTAKAILDDVALRLQRDADAKAVLVGEADPSESGAKALAAQRALNTKAYLVKEKGIDASRLETRTGSEPGQQTQIWLVPAGATFNARGTQLTGQPATGPRKRR